VHEGKGAACAREWVCWEEGGGGGQSSLMGPPPVGPHERLQQPEPLRQHWLEIALGQVQRTGAAHGINAGTSRVATESPEWHGAPPIPTTAPQRPHFDRCSLGGRSSCSRCCCGGLPRIPACNVGIEPFNCGYVLHDAGLHWHGSKAKLSLRGILYHTFGTQGYRGGDVTLLSRTSVSRT
jgi:hypothetical protein